MTETQLTSRFYLITLQGHPVYVGYTNRPIKQRFAEHKHDKDFGDIEPEIMLLDTLSFDFSWDIGVINGYAQQVDDRERELIIEYGTQDSRYQKAIGGGQTWADVKHFVRTNHNNPKFAGLADDEILTLIAQGNALRRRFLNVINGTRPAEQVRVRNIVNNTKPAEELRLKDVIGGTKPAEQVQLKHVIGGTKPAEEVRLKSVIGSTKPTEEMRLKNIVRHTQPSEEMRLKNIVRHTQPSEEVRLKGVISGTKPVEEVRLKSVIGNTQTKQEN